MAVKDQYHNQEEGVTLAPAARTAAANGAWIDTLRFHSVLMMILTGVITDGTHTFTVQDADKDDKSDAAAVDAKYLQYEGGAQPALQSAHSGKTRAVGYLGSKRYVRVNVAVAGATTGGIYGVAALLGHPQSRPTRD